MIIVESLLVAITALCVWGIVVDVLLLRHVKKHHAPSMDYYEWCWRLSSSFRDGRWYYLISSCKGRDRHCQRLIWQLRIVFAMVLLLLVITRIR